MSEEKQSSSGDTEEHAYVGNQETLPAVARCRRHHSVLPESSPGQEAASSGNAQAASFRVQLIQNDV